MTTPGIGAASILGVAFEFQAAPTGISGVAAVGGALTAGTYQYKLTYNTAYGETLPGNEFSVTTSAGNLTAQITVGALPTGVISYNVYRTAAGGGSGTELKAYSNQTTTTFNDTAVGAPAGAMPTTNTAANPGVYVAPTKFMPFIDENLKHVQATQWRRPIRSTAGLVGAVAGDSHIEGDVQLESLSDCIIYFLAVSRCTFVKTGAGPFTYTFTPSPQAVPTRTLSITTLRNGVVFGYLGMVTASFKFNVDAEQLKFTATMLGQAEAVQTAPGAPTWPVSTPFGAGTYQYQIPTATQIFDADTFEFNSNDNAVPQYRLKNTGTGAQFINFGESAADLKTDRDFITRTEYDAFKALTSQSITMLASKGANESIQVTMPVAFKDTYEVNYSGQGALVRAAITYQAAIDGTGKHYQIVVITPTENIS